MNSHIMDTPDVKIGSKTVNGRCAPPGPEKNQPRQQNVVVIMVHGEVVREMDQRTLTRFSKTVAVKFPRAKAVVVAGQNGQAGIVNGSPNGEVRKAGVQKPNTNVTTAAEIVKKVFDIDDSRFWQQPSREAVTVVLEWMENARATPRGDAPPDCAIPDPTETDFRFLCEVYAATIILDIRPYPRALKREVKDFVSSTPPSLDTLKAVHELLPLEDGVVTRTVTSFFQHGEKGGYTREEVAAIEEYVMDPEGDVALWERFGEIQKARDGRQFTPRGHGGHRGRRAGRAGRKDGGGTAPNKGQVSGGEQNGEKQKKVEEQKSGGKQNDGGKKMGGDKNGKQAGGEKNVAENGDKHAEVMPTIEK